METSTRPSVPEKIEMPPCPQGTDPLYIVYVLRHMVGQYMKGLLAVGVVGAFFSWRFGSSFVAMVLLIWFMSRYVVAHLCRLWFPKKEQWELYRQYQDDVNGILKAAQDAGRAVWLPVRHITMQMVPARSHFVFLFIYISWATEDSHYLVSYYNGDEARVIILPQWLVRFEPEEGCTQRTIRFEGMQYNYEGEAVFHRQAVIRIHPKDFDNSDNDQKPPRPRKKKPRKEERDRWWWLKLPQLQPTAVGAS
jgi:hypothetical protein